MISKKRTSRGFSLIELLVVTAIFMLLSLVVLAGNARFGSSIILKNLAQDVALTMREAQVYSVAVRRYDPVSGPSSYAKAYGIHASLGTSYELFADADSDGIWDAGETVKTTTLSGGYTISSLCAPEATCDKSRVDIIFKRPDPDACISADSSLSYNGACVSAIQRVAIVISSPRGETATIVVDASGQISVH